MSRYEITDFTRTEEEVKKSRFTAMAFPVSSPKEAKNLIEKYSDPKADHNCWAYRIGDTMEFADNGEPSGTAGKPILSAIEIMGMDFCAVLIIRYFGGVKLGASGLTRAYRLAALNCLKAAPKKEILSTLGLDFVVHFDFIGSVYSLFQELGMEPEEEKYFPRGVFFSVSVKENEILSVKHRLKDKTGGSVLFPENEKEV
jgi:putative IMPACT (imprinted ancient) family translation regulator